MDNQHTKITGYRSLTQAEIDLMNRVKAHGMAIEALLDEVQAHVSAQHKATYPTYGEVTKDADGVENPFGDTPILDTPEEIAAKEIEKERLKQAEAFRWQAIAKTHLQEGLMALTRAVAQPTTF